MLPHTPPGVITALAASGLATPLLAALLILLGPAAGTRAAAACRATPAPLHILLARSGQLLLVALPAAAATLLALSPVHRGALEPAPTTPLLTEAALAAAIAFLLLIAERHLAATRPSALPEAPALRRLALAAAITAFATALAATAAALHFPHATPAIAAIAFLPGAIGLELALRTASQLFLPPPRPADARGAATATTARLLAVALRAEPAARAAAPSGLDFSRSWALRFVRAALLPATALLLLAAWGLSGVVLVPVDGRAVYERFGAPVRVLHPGLHAILPWPLGRARPVEYGALHEIALGGDTLARPHALAEDADPQDANRLWDRPHPGELTVVIASPARAGTGAATQLFQSVSADLRVLWRVGLTDPDAIHATYGTSDPPAFLRATAGSVVASSFAGLTLERALGADREAMGNAMRARLQTALDEGHSGLQAVAVIVEAIHPPAGAADAYHAVRAAEIAANAAIFAERGRALTIRAQSRQFEFEQTAAATARATEITEAARSIDVAFTADRTAAASAGHDFLFERYLQSLTRSLSGTPLTIIDSRLWQAGAPTIDLRPMPGATPTTSDGE